MILNKDNCILFWGSESEHEYLSNFYPVEIPYNVLGNYILHSSEQLFMLNKAAEFGDLKAYDQILQTKTPREAKKIGRTIKGFDPFEWIHYRDKAMCDALYQKFNIPELKEKLLSTRGRTLVEASPLDTVWGIGMSANDPDVYDMSKWKGGNLLGTCLMFVRDKIYAESFT